MNLRMNLMMIIFFWNTGKKKLFSYCATLTYIQFLITTKLVFFPLLKRLEEMQKLTEQNKYGEVTQISKPDFVKEVTEASKECYVVVHLFKD